MVHDVRRFVILVVSVSYVVRRGRDRGFGSPDRWIEGTPEAQAPLEQFFAPCRLQSLDDEPYVLGSVAGKDEDRVGRLDHDEIVHANEGDRLRPGRSNQVTAAVDHDVGRADGVPGGVTLGELPGRLPAPDVVPAEVARDDGEVSRFALLHHADVDGDTLERGEHVA